MSRAFEYTVTRLPAVWPGTATPVWSRKRPPFKTIWTRALDLLQREVARLHGENVQAKRVLEAHHGGAL